MDLDTVTGCLDYYGGMAASLAGQHVKMGGGSWAYVTREPLGVVGGIGAWNYPMQVRFVSLNTVQNKRRYFWKLLETDFIVRASFYKAKFPLNSL